MNSLGLYFGPKLISIVETKGKKVVSKAQIPQSTLSNSGNELEEKVPAEVKTIEIIALFKEELRKNKIEAKEAILCLSGKDLIIRTFEMPVLPEEELQSAINFEAKKYIPFKVEDLISDFQINLDKVSRTNLVLFMGIKKDTLERYSSLLGQLNMKLTGIEYSAFSMLRCLKLAGASDRDIIGMVGVDLSGEDEVNFTVLENGFPLFSRDINLAGGPEEFGKSQEANPAIAMDKLKTEIRVSLDYYHRKFPAKNIKKIFFLSSQEYRSDLEAFMSESGLNAQFIDTNKCIDKAISYSLNFLKGYTSSLANTMKSGLKVDLLMAKERAKSHKERTLQTQVLLFLKGLKVDFRIVVAAILICLGVYGYGAYRKQPLLKEIGDLANTQVKVTTVDAAMGYEELSARDSEYKRKIQTLNKIIEGQLYATVPLDAIPRLMPRGMWFTRLSFKKIDDNRVEFVLEGMVYVGDGDKELEAINRFVADLKENPALANYFTGITINSLDRGQFENSPVTNFYISCRRE